MKKLQSIINCVGLKIKNYFFNKENNDIYHECIKATDLLENKELENEKNQIEEYVKNYNITTRWQTV